MARANDTVAALLEEYSALLSITGGDAFRARVYDKAARAIAGHHEDIAGLDAKELQKISGVGASIAEKITEYFENGQIAAIEALRAKIPAGVRAMTVIPGLGPRKAMMLYEELGISSVAELEEAIKDDRLKGLRGFGAKTAENLLHGIELSRAETGRVQVDAAMRVAEDIVAALSGVSGCQRCTYAGSLRRMRETIGDIDILAAAPDSKPLMDAFARLPLVAEVIVKGEKKTSVRTKAGLQVDLRVVPLESWGAALQYFTGSKQHNVRIREFAVRKGLKLSEYGLFRVDDGSLVVSETEEDVYAKLGLAWVPPAMREDRGEVDAALKGTVPDLVTVEDIQGDLHTHTNLTDGVSTLEEMVAAARERGLRYYAVTDHAKNLPMQRMTDAKMLRQREEVAALSPYRRMTLLHGTELNIDPDGNVDWPEEFLAGFDITVASVHSHFTQPREQMTQRVIRAMENPYVNVIGHLTGRKIGQRPPVDLDLEAIFEAAARTGTALEVNSFPDRLDLKDEHIMWARRYGPKFAVDTDSHSPVHLSLMRFGVATAQRGWLTKVDVINTWPLAKLRRFLRKGRPA